MSGWNQAPLPRDQILLFRETLGDRIPQNHSVRLMWEILDGLDWTSWERRYALVVGQPPIHPKVMAGAILYGLTHGIRSSRRLEWACGHAVDFMWLVEGRTIDHSTFCGFRTRFKQELKDVFRQLGLVAMHMGLVSLNQVALDGTRVKANSSAHATASAKTLEQRLAVLDEQVERMLTEADEVDGCEKDLFGDSVSTTGLPKELRELTHRQERLRKALQAAQKIDAQRQKSKGTSKQEDALKQTDTSKQTSTLKQKDGSKRLAKVPVADPDAAIMPNKEGGFAPNFNPLAAADGVCGMIVDADVLNELNEAQTVIPTVERIEATFGQRPAQFLADSAFATGGNLSELAERGIEALMPVEQTLTPDQNLAERGDPSAPVSKEDWSKLPRRPRTGKLDRSAFVFDRAQDRYFCPAGRVLVFDQVKTKGRANGEASQYRVYQCPSCVGCELAGECLSGQAQRRTVSHDQYEDVRQAAAARLKTKSGKEAYARRAHLAETPNAVIKQVLGLRQFLLRGLEKVRTEWLWACTAFNIRKLIRVLEILRVGPMVMPV